MSGGKVELVLAGSRVELVLGIVEPVLEPVLGGGGTPSHLFSPDLNVNSITIGYGLWVACVCIEEVVFSRGTTFVTTPMSCNRWLGQHLDANDGFDIFDIGDGGD